jgi:hypothetical protein
VTPTSFTLPLSSVFASYYQSSASATTGGQFLLSQQFVVMGNVNQIQSVSGTLTNSVGGSSSFTAQAQQLGRQHEAGIGGRVRAPL